MNDKFAVVTGASSGIGLEFAKLLINDGYDLLISSRSENELQTVRDVLLESSNNKIEIFAIDLSKPSSADLLWEKVGNRRVDILINSAGFGDLHKVVDADWDKLSSMISLNITALTRLSQLAAISMKKHSSGNIVNIASIASFFPGPGMAVYYATKAYVLSFSEALSQELINSGVLVTALCPGPTASGFQKTADAQDSTIFNGKLPSSAEVAKYGYESMVKGKVVAVHGIKNKIQALILPRIAPRSLVRRVVEKAQN